MKVAVITPYHGECAEWLRQCHDSVRTQTLACQHIMVADGRPDPLVDSFDVQHIVLPQGHANYGDTPRAIGALSAISQGFDAIAFLDADNWYKPAHVESLIALQAETGAQVCTSGREIRRLDGSFLTVCPFSDGELFVDTNCYLFTKPAFRTVAEWGVMDDDLHAIGDRVVLHQVKQQGYARAHSWRATSCYRATATDDYRLLGAPVPEGAKKSRDTVRPAVEALLARGGPDLSGQGATDEFRRSVLARTTHEPDAF
ncbi:MAG: glycosyltransferase [Alphaproteobacteria bacterium]|nr:glycosyltransferase [Alphaproteobacteria bacterium]